MVLKAEFRMSEDQALRVMITAHRRGVCIVAVYTKDVAEAKATKSDGCGPKIGLSTVVHDGARGIRLPGGRFWRSSRTCAAAYGPPRQGVSVIKVSLGAVKLGAGAAEATPKEITQAAETTHPHCRTMKVRPPKVITPR